MFIEPNKFTNLESTKTEYENYIMTHGSGVLIATATKDYYLTAEFKSKSCSCIILVGVPNAIWSDFHIQSKIKYLDKKEEKYENYTIEGNLINLMCLGKLWYQNLSVKLVNQLISRIIR